MSGRVRPGEHLPLERLAQQWDISVTPVREALLALRGVGLVDLEPRRGFTVSALTRRDIEDLYLVQAGIAGELAARATRGITAAALAELERLQEGLTRAAHTVPEQMDGLDQRFHRLINSSAESAKLAWLLTTMGLNNGPQHWAITVHGWQDACLVDHPTIQRALQGSDPSATRHAMHAHIVHTGCLLIKHLENREFWAD
jgi:DNA-binding GntR family transcriptional regulator